MNRRTPSNRRLSSTVSTFATTFSDLKSVRTHNDSLNGAVGFQRASKGRRGDDALTGGQRALDRFEQDTALNGADVIFGGGWFDTVDYADRSARVTVILGDGMRATTARRARAMTSTWRRGRVRGAAAATHVGQ